MPPKKAPPASSKKTEAKKKEKIIEVRNGMALFIDQCYNFWEFSLLMLLLDKLNMLYVQLFAG